MPAQAHGFGARYDLPLPLGLWIAGAAATVLLSFVAAAVAVRADGRNAGLSPARAPRLEVRDAEAVASASVAAQLIAVAALVLIVVAGLVGDQTPSRNLAPTAIWIGWWVGFSYLSAFVGDVWPIVNPWSAIFGWCERFPCRDRAAGRARAPWPDRLGVWPATGLFLAFAWLELVWEGRAIPSRLAYAVIAYSVLTWAGMFLFGRTAWLQHADPFTLAFGVLAKFSPIEVPSRPGESGFVFRMPGAGLLRTEDVGRSLVFFVIVMLSTVTFDGLMATPLWGRIADALYQALPALGASRLAFIDTMGLAFFCALFVAVYHLIAMLTARASRGRLTPDAARRAFVLTLVPIAIAYLVAHYLSYSLIQGQLLVRLASDPFGFGWNLFGTAHFRPDIGIVGARFVWYASLVAIVLGHVIAVSLAHLIALRTLQDAHLAVRSQVPMLVLMVGYTMMSLWIIAQPIVE